MRKVEKDGGVTLEDLRTTLTTKAWCEIKDDDRFGAVATYMAGLFSQNPSIQFLNMARHIAQDFLQLLRNEERHDCLRSCAIDFL